MWRLKSIDIENIVSFHKAYFSVAQDVATLIFGRNEDNDSQPCNGSGKSSLIEAISFALTGEQLRKVKTLEEIINDSKDYAKVTLVLSNQEKGCQMTIVRRISRQASQQVQILMQYGAYDTEVEEIIQPTVADYNKYILAEIGLTKDEIYNYFILCDNKFESFFDCSDKNKKEIINNFSNGALVDSGIERLQADMMPIVQKLTEQENSIASFKGSISALESEIEYSKVKQANAQKERENTLERLENNIKESRLKIESLRAAKALDKEKVEQLQDLKSELSHIESTNAPLVESYQEISKWFSQHSLPALSDYPGISRDFQLRLRDLQIAIANSNEAILAIENDLADAQIKYGIVANEYQNQESENKKLDDADIATRNKICKEIEAIDLKLDVIEDTIKGSKKANAGLETEISQLQSLLNTAVTCPNCQHKFLAFQAQTCEDVKARIESLNEQISDNIEKQTELSNNFGKYNAEAGAKEKEVDAINKAIEERGRTLAYSKMGLKELDCALELVKDRLSNEQRNNSNLNSEIEKTSAKIDILRNRLFGEANGILDGELIMAKTKVEQDEAQEAFVNGQLSQYRQSFLDLKNQPAVDFASSLKSSLANYQSQLKKAENEKEVTQSSLDQLKAQEVNFTMFKSHIARKKIDALALIVNDFLEKIGSDIRLKLEGFSVTKKGKLQDKISVQVFRDGADCGSYQKFSGGEKARLNLACILSLHALTNANCEDGKGLDFLIIDELLDKSDEVGIATYCEALNKLKQTALLITQGAVSEGYPHKLLVTKRQGVSTIN